MTELNLAHGLQFDDLYDEAGLGKVDAAFMETLAAADAELADKLKAARAAPGDVDIKAHSDMIFELAPHYEDFVANLFGVKQDVDDLIRHQKDLACVYEAKRLFVQRKANKMYKAAVADEMHGEALELKLRRRFNGQFDQVEYARHVMRWLDDAKANAHALDTAARYACWARHTPEGRRKHKDDVLFQDIDKTDFSELVEYKEVVEDGIKIFENPDGHAPYHRDGFKLTDHGTDLVGCLNQTDYCITCHERGRDSCTLGLKDKKTGDFTDNPLGVTLEGCPLEEMVSQFHKAKADGFPLTSLGIVCIDNPVVAMTGHRICNDCMKSCVYQKQTPVNIPQIETRVLKDVLELPWGFEIYSLMTRWNPLNIKNPLPKAETGYNILVVGAGPAGVAASHFLMNEGHSVWCIDGLKIEPLDPAISGVDQLGERVPFEPLYDIEDLYENLDKRTQAGFGGVAEYGITVRWDKNFLKFMRLVLERRKRFHMFGGVRFGSAITAESAFEMGFDHVALCMGAGKPTFLNVPNGLARGVRQASDFLMALQLTGAAKKTSIANLQLRLPVVVIGGGLTAIDTATEALAYYVRQVEKFVERYDALVADSDEATVRAPWTEEDQQIADEFIEHGRACLDERAKAKSEGREADFTPLLNSWGGATIAYRRLMTRAPSYQLNHEEIEKAFEQGMRFAELLAPDEIKVDQYGHVNEIVLMRQTLDESGRPQPSGEITSMPARAVLIAAGTQPNTVLSREHPGFSELDGKYFQAFTEDGEKVTPPWTVKPEIPEVVMSPREDGRCMSFFGDLHPSFAGNVVKALSSAKQGYPVVDRMLAKVKPSSVSPAEMEKVMNHGLRPVVESVERLTSNVVQVNVRAPFGAKAFEPGQFYRLQNFEANAMQVGETSMAMEGVALTGAIIDDEVVSLIVLEMGGSSNLIATLQPGEPVVLMGPTGAPTHMLKDKTVLLAGGGLGNAVLLTIHKGLKEAGSKVLYFAAYKTVKDRFHIDLVEKYSDVVVWCCDEAPGFEPTRPQDKGFVGNIVQAMLAYAGGELGETEISLGDVDHMIVIGSDIMMNAVREARFGPLEGIINPDHTGVASINSPMQCMMKEICAQCLQPHKDPETGKEEVVFSCFNQDQPIDRVVFPALRQRLCQNQVHEKLTKQWIAKCMPELEKERPRV